MVCSSSGVYLTVANFSKAGFLEGSALILTHGTPSRAKMEQVGAPLGPKLSQ